MRLDKHSLANTDMRTLLTAGCLWAATLSLAAASSAAAQEDTNQRYRDYLATYAPLAVAEMQAARIPASIKLAQGLLESGGGSSDLARLSNNHFGIKCNNGWTGRTHHAEDDDYHRGRLVASCFRAYDHPAESYSDHSAFLVGSSRYAKLFELDIHDYKAWARGLKSAGYATSSTYAHKLIEIIELYELYQYDQGVSILPANPDLYASGPKATKPTAGSNRAVLSGAAHSKPGSRTPHSSTTGSVAAKPTATVVSASIETINDVDYTTALPGETLPALAKRVDRSLSELTRYNESLNSRRSGLTAGQRVYLQPKRNSFRGRAKEHRVGPHEDLQTIADQYGVTTQSLHERNHIAVGREPKAGQEVLVRGRRRGSDIVAVMPSAQRRREIEGLQRPVPSSQPLPGSPSGASGLGSSTTVTGSRTASASDRVEVIELPPASRPMASTATNGTSADPTTIGARSQAATPASQVASRADTSPRFATVASGDTLYSISRASGVSVAEIRALNGLRDNTIKVGQRLLLHR